MQLVIYEDRQRTIPLIEITEEQGGLALRFREPLNSVYLFPEDVEMLRGMLNG
jgi:hypothetical protein